MVKVNYKNVLDILRMIWIVCFGAITTLTVSGLYLSHVWLPLVGLFLVILIRAYGAYNMQRWSMNCSLMTHYTIYALGVTSIIMLIANLINTNFITNQFSEFSKQEYPFHVSFIIYPVAAVFYAIGLWRRNKTEYCKACRDVALFSTSETLRHNLLNHESKLQIKTALWLSVTLSVITYVYYYIYYRSGSIGRLYSPDIFFMYGLPAAAYVISVVYFYTKYAGLQLEVTLMGSFDDNNRDTVLRYIVVCEDQLLLKEKILEEIEYARWDTPAVKSIDFYDDIPLEKSKALFAEMSGVHEFDIRRLFATNTKLKNVLHFAVFIPEDKMEECQSALGGEWMTLHDLDIMLSSGIVARSFALEIHRVHTITMAWKTYDRDGRRLYPIKNYRPTFRLRDFKRWDVDYEDLHWMNVAENNQDKPFYNLRHFWRKYVSGIESRWNKRNS